MKSKLLLVVTGGLGRGVLEHVIPNYECAFLGDGDATVVDGVPAIGKQAKLLSSMGNISTSW